MPTGIQPPCTAWISLPRPGSPAQPYRYVFGARARGADRERRQLGYPAKPVRYRSFDLLRKRLAVSPCTDAKNRALVPITQRQCHNLGGNLL